MDNGIKNLSKKNESSVSEEGIEVIGLKDQTNEDKLFKPVLSKSKKSNKKFPEGK